MATNIAETKEVTNGGSNSAAVKADVKKAAEAIVKLKSERAGISAKISEIRSEKVKAHGIKAAEFNAMLRLYELQNGDLDDGEQKAAEALTSLQVCAEALGLSSQPDLFGGAPNKVAIN